MDDIWSRGVHECDEVAGRSKISHERQTCFTLNFSVFKFKLVQCFDGIIQRFLKELISFAESLSGISLDGAHAVPRFE